MWLVRFLHVLGAALWLGGFALVALDPARARSRLSMRYFSYVGTATILLGLLLVDRTRGWSHFGHGEWGMIAALGLLLSILWMGVGDGGLRRATSASAVRRWALAGVALGTLAVAIMTRAPYAR